MLTDNPLVGSILHTLKTLVSIMENQGKKAPEATPEQIREWVKRDLESASALLNMIRMDTQLMDEVAMRIVEKTQAAQAQEKAQAKNEAE